MDGIALDRIQGDMLYRFPKDAEYFLFFHISDPNKFRAAIPELVPDTATRVLGVREDLSIWKENSSERKPIDLLNIGFSKDGLHTLSIDHEKLGDEHFSRGQLGDAKMLGDPMKQRNGEEVPDWEDEFLELYDPKALKIIHGVIIVAGTEDNMKEREAKVVEDLKGAASIVYRVEGRVLDERREHFGWVDGISNPYVTGVTKGKPFPGQNVVKPGVLLLGAEGDPHRENRPEWAYGGSFMVFRKLQQFVPEFKYFLRKEAEKEVGVGDSEVIEKAKSLLCARFFGRWSSGTPLQLHPAEDSKDPKDASCSERNNNFQYTFGSDPPCPYAAHIRKVNPRNNLDEDKTLRSSIMRTGIPYGEKFDKNSEEGRTHTTSKERGLAFVAYQSVLANGFRRQQIDWSNNPDFPPFVGQQRPGFDGIIGQNAGAERETIRGIKLFTDYVKPRAGGYFFIPPIETLEKISKGQALN